MDNLEFLILELKNYRFIQLSFVPKIPGDDELITHEVLNVETVNTKTGILLILELKNLETNEIYTYTYQDIVKIKIHESDIKYYLYTLDRGNLSSFIENNHLNLLSDVKSIEDFEKYSVPLLTNRIIIVKNYSPTL